MDHKADHRMRERRDARHRRPDQSSRPVDPRVRDQVRRWRDELVDLSLRNPLINFRPTRRSTVEITEPEPAQILDGLGSLPTGWGFHYPAEDPDVDPTGRQERDGEDDDRAFSHAPEAEDPHPGLERRPDELLTTAPTAGDLSQTLHNLERRARQEYIDKGLHVLYLGLGMLDLRDRDNSHLQSPLLLVPVHLHRESVRDPFRLRPTEVDVVLNPALKRKLENDFGIILPEPSLDDLDVETFLETIASQIPSTWRVEARAVLRTMSFFKEAMYRDLSDHEELISQHPLINALAEGRHRDHDYDFEPLPEARLDREHPPEVLVSILDADATQRQCIVAAIEGKTFVMDGPPGSGKSQTIVNIIANLIHRGRSVLFVSEKAAALDVVKSRLDDKGLGEYVLELHSHKATRKEVAQELGRALVTRPRFRDPLTETAISTLREAQDKLNNAAVALNEQREGLGQSLHQVLGRLAQLEAVPVAPRPDLGAGDLDAARLAAILESARKLQASWAPVSKGDRFLWRDLVDPEWVAGHLHEIRARLTDARDAVDELVAIAGDVAGELLLPFDGTAGRASQLLDLLEVLSVGPEIPARWLTLPSLEPLRGRAETRAQECRAYLDEERSLTEDTKGNWRRLDPDIGDRIRRSLDGLASLRPPLDLLAVPVSRVENLHGFLAGAGGRLRELEGDVRALLGAFGFDVSPDTEWATKAVELGLLLAGPHRPARRWLSPDGARRAREALEVLARRIEQCRAAAAACEPHFLPSALDLDLSTFRRSDGKAVLSRASKAGRRNRTILRQHVPGGKVRRSTAHHLDALAAWQRAVASLRHAEQDHADALGQHYRGLDTDPATVASAIATATRVLDLVGERPVPERLADLLAPGAADAEQWADRAQRTASRLEAWERDLGVHLPEQRHDLASLVLCDLARWCDEAARLLGDLQRDLVDLARALERDDLPVSALARTADRITATHRLRTGLDRSLREDTALLGPLYRGLDTDFDDLRRALDKADRVQALISGPVPERTALAVAKTARRPDVLRGAVDQYRTATDAVLSLFQEPQAARLAADLDVSLEEAGLLLTELLDTCGDVHDWEAFVEARRELDAQGLGACVDHCVTRKVPEPLLCDVIERAVLSAWADAVIADDRALLEPIRSKDRDRLVRTYRDLDRRLADHARVAVSDACNARKPTTDAGAAGIIQREAQKKRKHRRIKDLLADTGPVAQAIKPCFMMSPLSVSQFLPASLTFDVVIFDEASQVRPCDAINSLYRGRQHIIAGDQRQLPPTSFFDRQIGDDSDEYEEGQFEDFESILDLAKGSAGVRSLPLRWHYRSQHESLITYSNYAFYGGRLITFPGALQSGPDLGLHLIHVPDGVYARGGARDNPREARKVVERVLHHAEHHPHLTLGVVAFSDAQAYRIERELELARRDRPDLDAFFQDDRLTGFFVKNLENVQGDERDIIIFSVGYGRDDFGRLTMNFGPLNRQGGERRLNVAITRARRRVEIVTSILHSDIPETAASGLRHLRRYLEFAARGTHALTPEVEGSRGEAESPLEEEVLCTIRSWGYEAVPQVGQAGYRIDIGVRHPTKPGMYVLGVECDGASYHSSRVARDRDRLRQEILEGLGWTLHRIWSLSWYRDRAKEEERLRSAIEHAIARDRRAENRHATARHSGPNRNPPKATVDPGDVDIVPLPSIPPWARPYQVARLRRPKGTWDPDEPTVAERLQEPIVQIVSVEGPISRDLCAQRLRAGLNVGRMGARLKAAFNDAVARLLRRGDLEEPEPGFLTVRGSSPPGVRCATPENADTVRKVEHVPRMELCGALLAFVSDAKSISEEELTKRVAALFGWNRRGPDIVRAMTAALDALEAEGYLLRTQGRIEPGPTAT